MMAKIVSETEHQIRLDPPPRRHNPLAARLSVAETICECMAHSAEDLELAAIAIFTETGSTARLLSKYHPSRPFSRSRLTSTSSTVTCCSGVPSPSSARTRRHRQAGLDR